MSSARRRIKLRKQDRAYTPDPRQHYTLPALAEGGTAWLDGAGHITYTHPKCTEPGCGHDAMHWSQCRCGQRFALCVTHAVPPRDLGRERAEHNATCPAMAAVLGGR